MGSAWMTDDRPGDARAVLQSKRRSPRRLCSTLSDGPRGSSFELGFGHSEVPFTGPIPDDVDRPLVVLAPAEAAPFREPDAGQAEGLHARDRAQVVQDAATEQRSRRAEGWPKHGSLGGQA